MEVLFLIGLILSVIFCYRADNTWRYKKTQYYLITRTPYSSLVSNKGRYGEYLIYNRLLYMENSGGRFLFNIYIPKGDNETTEIDLLLICSSGLFVFESKNYSGWIFGNEAHDYWTQVLPKGRECSHKERFYNPIKQNASHIKYLKHVVGENLHIRSIIVFSDRCILKDITLHSKDISVINQYEVISVVKTVCRQMPRELLGHAQINDIYNKLLPYTQVNPAAKERHAKLIDLFPKNTSSLK